jgi:hypothetical protein
MRYFPVTGALALLVLSGAAVAESSEVRWTPSITVSEEANDNIREVAQAARTEFVTRAQPGLALHYLGPYSLLDASYNLDYRYYARGTRGEEFNHAASLKGSQGFWENFLTVDASDTFSRVSLDIARDTTQESVLLNQVDQNTAMVSPYLTWHPGGKSLLKTGYRFSDVRYWHSTTAIDKQVHSGFANYSHKLTERIELTAGYNYSKTDTETTGFQEQDVSAGLRYEYGEGSVLFGSFGNTWLDFSNGPKSSNLFWDVGVNHNLGYLLASLETRVQYSEDPVTLATKQSDYTAKLEKALERGRLAASVAYSEYEVTLDPTQNRRRLQLVASGNHELLPGLNAGLNATGERIGQSSLQTSTPSINSRYHLVASGFLSYLLAEGTTLSGTYTHVSYRQTLNASAGSIEVNRGVLELRKTF